MNNKNVTQTLNCHARREQLVTCTAQGHPGDRKQQVAGAVWMVQSGAGRMVATEDMGVIAHARRASSGLREMVMVVGAQI